MQNLRDDISFQIHKSEHFRCTKFVHKKKVMLSVIICTIRGADTPHTFSILQSCIFNQNPLICHYRLRKLHRAVGGLITNQEETHMNYTLNIDNRKNLVKKIEELTGLKAITP